MKQKQMYTRLVSSMERIFPDTGLEAKEWQSGAALLGERLNFQLAYCWLETPAWGTVETETKLEGVTVRTVELEPAEYVCPGQQSENFCRTVPGLYPDILAPAEGELRLRPCQWRALWVSIDTKDEEPGQYPVTVRIRAGGEIVGEETFLFELLPCRLPPQRLRYTQWLHTDCIAHQYHTEVFSERWWELTERYIRFAAEHGINMILTPLFTPPLDTLPGGERLTVQLIGVTRKDDSWQFDFSGLERWIAMCERCGIRYLEGSHLFTQWGAEHAPKIIADVNGRQEQVFGWETDAAGEEYISFLEKLLPKLTAYLKEKGLEGRFYFHISDEPSESHVEHYGRLSDLVHRLTDGFPVLDALSDYAFYEKGFVDVPVCATQYIEPFLAHKTPRLWAYYCGCHVNGVSNRLLGMPGVRNRCIGLQLYDAGMEGFLHWGYNFWLTQYGIKAIDPYRVSDAGGGFAAGDSFSVYPGEDGPIAASGLELFFEALQDLRALELAEELCGRDRVESLYAETAFRAFDCCAKEPGEVLDLRKRVNELIMESCR